MAQRSLFFAIIVLCSLAQPALAQDAASVPISEEARAHFNAGVSYLQDPDGAKYEEAHREFTAAYKLSPSWKILGNLGIAAYRLERDGEALAAFQKFLTEGGQEIDSEERAQFQRDAQTLNAAMVRLKVSSNPPGAVITDERIPQTGSTIRNRYAPLSAPQELGVRAGHHRFTASLEGRADVVWEVDLEPGQSLEHVFSLAAAGASPTSGRPSDQAGGAALTADSGSSMRTWSYVAFGVGVVGLGAGTLFALQAKGDYDDANAFCPSFPCNLTQDRADQREELADSADGKKTLAIVGFAAGGVGLAAGTALFLMSSGQSEQPATGLDVRPFVGFNSVGVTGGF